MLGTAGCQEDPFDFGQPRDCTLPSQNEWVYDLMLNAYLWQEHLPDVDPTAFEDPETMVAEIRYQEVDRWSRVSDLKTSDALFEEGMVIGLGTRTSRDPNDRVVFSFVHPLSPAGLAGLDRGDVLLGAGGFTIDEVSDNDLWDEVFGENEPGVAVSMIVESDGQTQEMTITKDWYPLVTVPFVEIYEEGGRNVGYLHFTTFVEPSQEELSTAFARFNEAAVRDVIIDMRYNGGGRISTARHLMDLLVGRVAQGKVSYKVDYTGVLSDEDSTRHLEPVDESLAAVDKIVFITTGSSLSASELVINGVRPHANVTIVGGTTGGKPVGSRSWEFCDKVANPITFKLLNAEDFGDYFEGFNADCGAYDDVLVPLPSAEEASTAAALRIIAGDGCPPAATDGEEASVQPGTNFRAGGVARRPPPPGSYPGLDELQGLF